MARAARLRSPPRIPRQKRRFLARSCVDDWHSCNAVYDPTMATFPLRSEPRCTARAESEWSRALAPRVRHRPSIVCVLGMRYKLAVTRGYAAASTLCVSRESVDEAREQHAHCHDWPLGATKRKARCKPWSRPVGCELSSACNNDLEHEGPTRPKWSQDAVSPQNPYTEISAADLRHPGTQRLFTSCPPMALISARCVHAVHTPHQMYSTPYCARLWSRTSPVRLWSEALPA